MLTDSNGITILGLLQLFDVTRETSEKLILFVAIQDAEPTITWA
jgi:hypothetical protein